jgi:hypothetical protein
LSPSTGPVVIGLRRPEIVLPRWLLDRSPAEQRVVLDHEAEHIKAGDALVLAGACAAVAVMPWNAALWYMLSRIRLAVELDCDARVLRRGVSVSTYGTLLIDLAEQALPLGLTAAALADDASHLHQRIIAMKPQIPRFALLRAGSAAVVGLVALLAACETTMPTESDIKQMDAASAERTARQFQLVRDSVKYVVDGIATSELAARKIAAERINTINVSKSNGAVSTITIRTKALEDSVLLYSGLLLKRRRDSAEVNGLMLVDRGKAMAERDGAPPIFIVDGVRADASALAKISRDRILSVDVVKGKAALATYGPDAGHGVVSVTTKK